MSEEAKLFLLKDRLNQVRREKWYVYIGIFVIIFVFGVFFVDIEETYGLNPTIDSIVFIVVCVIAEVYASIFYQKKEEKIMQEIRRMAYKSE